MLVGTSGDTGSSAIEAVRQFDNISIVVLYPKGRGISLLQELQMTTVGETDKNVKVIAVDGSSDDLDVPIESCFNDIEFKHKYNLGSVNSVNICRVLVQVVHYFFTYLKICPLADRSSDIAFSIPTGAAGGQRQRAARDNITRGRQNCKRNAASHCRRATRKGS